MSAAATGFPLHKRISAVAFVGCRLEKARHIHVKFSTPLVDSSLEVHNKFRRDPFSCFALVNDALSEITQPESRIFGPRHIHVLTYT